MYWPLMEDTITLKDRLKMSLFLLTSSRLTNGPKVRKFEQEWSKWLGVKHSLYVSSGSTANSLLISAVKEYYGLKDGDKVLVPATTWMTNVAPVFQSGLQPIFCDINLGNFSFDLNELKHIASIHSDIKVIFITHLIGLSSDVEKIREIFPEALILEDVCESHGVEGPDGKKRGTESIGSTFSFYFGHHMTTIEGGVVCTNNTELYELMRLKRSHGMAREASPEYFEQYAKENPDIDKMFLFMTDGYNFRNHEVCAVLGLSQLKRLDKNIKIRRENYKRFHSSLVHVDGYRIPYYSEGNSSFSFPIITFKDNIGRLKEVLRTNQIEYRPVISGNLLRHPAFKKYKLCTERELPNVEILHNNGLYVGNSQFVTSRKIDKLIEILEEVSTYV
jgi:CDP-6-deoxy-D-xylo-4-hexulose-3-dehydrase